jgi:hypothetical protein
MGNFDALKLAKHLQNAFEKSNFKSYTKLAETLKSNKATVSRTLTASVQTLTGKPSQPKREFLIDISRELKTDVNETLILGGYAPLETQTPISDVADEEFATLFYDSANWSEESRNDAIETAKDVFRRYQARERLKKANAEKTD